MNLPIETLRGLACLLLVAYHVIGADPSHGLRIQEGLFRWLNDGMAYLRMPLFTVLSGLVYGLRPFNGKTRAFLTGKVRRLLIPMLFVGTLFAVLQASMPGTNSSVGPWYLLHLQPVAHFWFVESLFWVFLVIWALERWNVINNSRGYVLAFTLACVLYLNLRGWSWLGLQGAIYLMPYFLVGLAVSRFELTSLVARRPVWLGLAALALGGVLLMGMPVPNPDRRTPLMLVTGTSLCLLLLSWNGTVSWLASIGRHSYAIYLFHVFFTAAVRIGLERIKVDGLLLPILFGILLGLAGPILVDWSASKFKWSALLLLGKTVKSRPRAVVAPEHLAVVQ